MECLGDASINTTATESTTENSRIGENLEYVHENKTFALQFEFFSNRTKGDISW